MLNFSALNIAAAPRWAGLLLAGQCVLVVAAYGELSAPALIAVAGTGLLFAGVGLARRAGSAAPPVGRGGRPWLGWLAAALAWELVTLAHPALLTLSDLLDPVLAPAPVRGAATVGWLLAGGWLLSRPRAEGRGP